MPGIADQKAKRIPTLFSPEGPESDSLSLQLTVVDRDTIDELQAYSSGDERELFALNALRIGVLALRQARGRVDADLIQRETQRMLSGLEHQLTAHAQQMQEKLSGSLKDYFDPQSGRFHERVQQLVKQDGELEQLLRRQIGTEDSELCKTLLGHFGQQSPLMKLLNPNESEGLLQALAQTLETQLTAQRGHVLREFSLDNKEGALARMVDELTTNHGLLSESLQKKIDEVVGEFSLDKEDSALSRLVRNVDRAQSTITREFSLDNEGSALSRLTLILQNTRTAIDNNLTLDGEDSSLARLRREMLTILTKHTDQFGVSGGSESGARQDDGPARRGPALDAARRDVRRCRLPVFGISGATDGRHCHADRLDHRLDQELQKGRLRRRARARHGRSVCQDRDRSQGGRRFQPAQGTR